MEVIRGQCGGNEGARWKYEGGSVVACGGNEGARWKYEGAVWGQRAGKVEV